MSASFKDESLDSFVYLFKILGSPVVLKSCLVLLKSGKPMGATEMSLIVGSKASDISHRLGIAVNAGLVDRKKFGNQYKFCAKDKLSLIIENAESILSIAQ
jgi:hypothetical protein